MKLKILPFFFLFMFSCSNFLAEVDPSAVEVLPLSPSIPSLTISGDVAYGQTTALAEVELILEWSEEVTGFSAEDVQVTNGTLKSFSGSDSLYTVTVENQVDSQVDILVDVDVVDQGNLDELFSYTFEADALTVVISSEWGDKVTQSPIPLIFEFSHEVESFDLSMVHVSGGTLNNLTGSGISFAGELELTVDGRYMVSIDADSIDSAIYSDVSNSLATYELDFDASRPQATLSTTISEGDEAGFGSLSFDIDFSEEVFNFDLSDLTVVNGELSAFSGSADSYSVVLTPDSDGAVSLTLNSDICEDSFGNSNDGDSFDFIFDSSEIGVTIETGEDSITNSAIITFDIAFSEDVAGFGLDDLTVLGGSLQNLTGSGSDYTVELVPSTQGEVSLSIASGQISNAGGNENSGASFGLTYDSIAPATPIFALSEVNSGDSLGAGSFANDVVKISLTTDYSSDTGSDLTREYTTDGLVWSAFSNPSYIASEGSYFINMRITDSAGNSSLGSEIGDVTLDSSSPDSPLVSIDSDPINASNYDNFSFTLSGSEEGAHYSYTIYDDGEGELEGNGTFDATGSVSITGLDLSAMVDGTILLQAKVTDQAGNESGFGQDSAPMDTIIPGALSIAINSSLPITSSNNDAFSFTIGNGEEGLLYNYALSSDGGGATIEGNGTFDSTLEVTIDDLDLSALRDGTMTLSATQTDSAENTSPTAEETLTIDAVAENSSSFSDDVSPTNVSAYTFTITGEEDSIFSYTISSSAGGSALSDSGTLDSTGEEVVGPLDLSGLADGYLILILSVTDINGNSSTSVMVVEKSSVVPDTGVADFSGESGSVTFDLSDHGTQTIPSGTVKYDTDELVGTNYDDRIKFSLLEDGESFTISGGSGFNTLDLTNYPSYDINLSAGDSGEDTGVISIDLGSGESATVTYSDFQRLEFSSNNFTGSPHALDLDTSDGTLWNFSDTSFELHTLSGVYKVGVIDFEGSLDLNFSLDTTFQPILDMSNKNGLIIFDYHDIDNYKYIRAYAKANRWTIGEMIDGSETTLTQLDETIDETAENALELRVTGTDGKTAELWSGGIMKVSYTFDDVLNDGRFGLTNNIAHTDFTINMTPTNWAPYVKSYDVNVSHSASSDTVLDLIADAIDFEAETLSLLSISGGQGSLTDNGNGTVTYTIPGVSFYGVDEYTYEVSDGVNVTSGTIRFDVVP